MQSPVIFPTKTTRIPIDNVSLAFECCECNKKAIQSHLLLPAKALTGDKEIVNYHFRCSDCGNDLQLSHFIIESSVEYKITDSPTAPDFTETSTNFNDSERQTGRTTRLINDMLDKLIAMPICTPIEFIDHAPHTRQSVVKLVEMISHIAMYRQMEVRVNAVKATLRIFVVKPVQQ